MFLPRNPSLRASASRLFENLRACGKFSANIDVCQLRIDREAGNDHPLHQLMRILMNDVPILKRARLGFVRVADQIDRLGSARLDKSPFNAARKSGAASSPQTRGFNLVSRFLRAACGKRLVANLRSRHLSSSSRCRLRPAFAVDVLEDDPLFARMRGSLNRCHGY